MRQLRPILFSDTQYSNGVQSHQRLIANLSWTQLNCSKEILKAHKKSLVELAHLVAFDEGENFNIFVVIHFQVLNNSCEKNLFLVWYEIIQCPMATKDSCEKFKQFPVIWNYYSPMPKKNPNINLNNFLSDEIIKALCRQCHSVCLSVFLMKQSMKTHGFFPGFLVPKCFF